MVEISFDNILKKKTNLIKYQSFLYYMNLFLFINFGHRPHVKTYYFVVTSLLLTNTIERKNIVIDTCE